MLGLTFTLDWKPLTRADAASAAALDAIFRGACAGDRRIRVAPLAADAAANPRCTVYFSHVGLLENYVARVAAELREADVALIGLEPAAPLEHAA